MFSTRSRLDFQQYLENFLGSENVYFQPPESLKLEYPCIVFKVGNIRNIYANNFPYEQFVSYQVTIIDKNPDSELFERFSRLPLCGFDRQFCANNLNHYIFTKYF